MTKGRYTLVWIELSLLSILIIGAFLLRTLPQLSTIFVNGNVLYREVDTWYHMRLADALVGGGGFLGWDMYAAYPGGAQSGYYPLLSWLVWLGGKFTNYEVAAAWLSPLFGSLTLIVVYLIGRKLWRGWVGVLAAGILAILPGEFFHRTMLGYPDHHFLEVFFLSLTVLLLLHARDNWRYSFAAGVSLGLYSLSWQGSSFLMLIIFAWYWFDFTRGRKGILRLMLIMGLTGLVIYLPLSIGSITFYQTLTGYLGLVLLPLTAELLRSRLSKENLLFVLTFSIPVAIVLLDISYRRISGGYTSIFEGIFSMFGGFGTYIQEAQPPTINIYLATMGVAFILAVVGLVAYIKNRGNPLIIIWSIIIMVAAIAQRRWGYYSAVVVSLFAAYSAYWVTGYVSKSARSAIVTILCIFMVATTLVNTITIARSTNDISTDWYNSMTWMRENSPSPFSEGEQAYYESSLTERPIYGVLSWWDYGHWIIRIAHRVPMDSPTHASSLPSQYLMAQTEEEAESLLKGYDVRYVVLDEDVLEGKFYAVVIRASTYDPALTNQYRLNCEAYRIWTGKSPVWKLVHEEGKVRIYERAK